MRYRRVGSIVWLWVLASSSMACSPEPADLFDAGGGDGRVGEDAPNEIDSGGGRADAGDVDPCEGVLAGPLVVVANVHTVGVTLELAADDGDLHASIRGPDGRWREGHPPSRVRPGLLATSFFDLEPETRYAVRVDVGGMPFCQVVETRELEPRWEERRALHVRAGAEDGDGSRARPFGTLAAAAAVVEPGDVVHVGPGRYHESVVVRRGGTRELPVRFVAEPGVVMDGAIVLRDFRTEGADEHSVSVPIRATYLARDGGRFHGFGRLEDLRAGRPDGACGEEDDVRIDEGWSYVSGRVHVRSRRDPSEHEWHYPTLSTAFHIEADFVHVVGFSIRSYGAEEGSTVLVEGSHVVVRGNTISGGNNGIHVRRSADHPADDVRIEENELDDAPTYDFPWCSVKSTDMEVSAIVLAGGTGAIVRGNRVRDFFNGVYTGEWPISEDESLAFDVDVYDNDLRRIGDDAFEPEGPSINQRFRINRFVDGLVGVSLAPVTVGPTFVMRNLIAGFRGTSFKWGNGSTGVVVIVHNTSVSAPDEGIAGLTYYGTGDRTTYLNNIFSSTWRLLRNQHGGTSNVFDFNDWYTTHRDPVFVWGSSDRIYSREELCERFEFECSGTTQEPGFVDAESGDYSLRPVSVNVDRGVVLPGLNDGYRGAAPDVGAFERE